jgi:hypothetical protein
MEPRLSECLENEQKGKPMDETIRFIIRSSLELAGVWPRWSLMKGFEAELLTDDGVKVTTIVHHYVNERRMECGLITYKNLEELIEAYRDAVGRAYATAFGYDYTYTWAYNLLESNRDIEKLKQPWRVQRLLLDPEERSAGRKIPAIKEVREQTGLPLRESKDLTDDIIFSMKQCKMLEIDDYSYQSKEW